MSNIFYIIPGWEDEGNEPAYLELKAIAENKGYKVSILEIDWTKPLTAQKIKAGKGDVLFGFSLGAILAWLIAQDYEVHHLILASMSPHYSFTDPEILQAFYDLCGKEFVDDIKNNLKGENKADRQTSMYGDQEGEEADILVPDTDHELTSNYLNEISKII